MSKERYFIVYKHTCPNDKVYVGITSQTLVQRWGYNGNGYIDNELFWKDIKRYGWDNIKHEVLYTGLTSFQASEVETNLIKELNCSDPVFGYNRISKCTTYYNEESYIKHKEGIKRSWEDPAVRARRIKAISQYPRTMEMRSKISKANKGNPRITGRPGGFKLSESQIANLRGKVPWNLGKTKETCPITANYAKKLKGKPKSENTKQLLRNRWEQRKDSYNRVWVHTNEIELFIDRKDLDHYIDIGYNLGRLNLKNITITKDDITMMVTNVDLEGYLKNGWVLGRSNKIKQAIKQASQKYIWMYEDLSFNSAIELSNYLRVNGYPEISDSHITSKSRTGMFCKSNKYPELEGKILRNPI